MLIYYSDFKWPIYNILSDTQWFVPDRTDINPCERAIHFNFIKIAFACASIY